MSWILNVSKIIWNRRFTSLDLINYAYFNRFKVLYYLFDNGTDIYVWFKKKIIRILLKNVEFITSFEIKS